MIYCENETSTVLTVTLTNNISYFWITVLHFCLFCVCLVKVIAVSLHWNMIYLSNSWGGRSGDGGQGTVASIFSAAHQVLRSPVAVFPIELHRLSCQSVCNSVHPSFIHLVIHLYLTRLTCFFTKAAGPTWRGRNNGHRTANSWDESMTSGAEHAHYSITSYLSSHICTTLRLGPSQVRGPTKKQNTTRTRNTGAKHRYFC